jgi:hypothetical protein
MGLQYVDVEVVDKDQSAGWKMKRCGSDPRAWEHQQDHQQPGELANDGCPIATGFAG